MKQWNIKLSRNVGRSFANYAADALPRVKAGEQNARHFYIGVAFAAHGLQCFVQLYNALQAVQVRQNGHQHPVGGRKGIHGQNAQRGGRVNQNVVVHAAYWPQAVTQQIFAPFARKFQVNATQQHSCREHVAQRGMLNGLNGAQFPFQHMINGRLQLNAGVGRKAERKVALRVEINAEHPVAHSAQPHC
ncbi:hypothetical protein SDC9_164910 [bioreactor metagenome]|uniref:Uncharacterized protein n=1 Tax=bioreactor metagenome TaxID=1076179 RepID=A0A645FUT6_9ZZZZ